MKKILLAASVLLLLASGCNKKTSATAEVVASTSDSVTAGSATIAYINMDSLVSKYDLYLDLRTAYETKAKKADSELTAKGRSLERDVMDYQEKVNKGLVTRAQAATIEEGLNKKQQTFVQHRDQVMNEMAEEEQVMLNQIHFSITQFLAEFNSDYRYGMIISSTGGGPVLNADPKLDITKIVLSGLNKKYADTKATTK